MVDNDGHTVLHWAAYQNNPKAIRFLLRIGATLDAPDKSGKTPLHWAAAHKSLNACDALVEEGADCFAIDDNEETPVAIAERVGKGTVPKVLAEALKRTMDTPSRTVRASKDAVLFGLVLPSFMIIGSLINHWLFVIPLIIATFFGVKKLNRRDIKETRNWAHVYWVFGLISITSYFYYFILVPKTHSTATFIAFTLYFLLYVFAMYKTVYTNPGVVEKDTFSQELFEKSLNSGVEINELSICFTCMALRPPRSHHCRLCNQCVARFGLLLLSFLFSLALFVSTHFFFSQTIIVFG